jgi:restriction system protein
VDARLDDLRIGDAVVFEIVSGPKSLVAVGVCRDGWPRDIDIPIEDERPSEREVRIIFQDATKRIAEAITRDSRALESIEWRDLERLIAHVFARLGFEVELTGGSKDGGIDVIITFDLNKVRKSYFIQIKHWKTPVGPNEVIKFLNVIAFTEAAGGLMLSTNGYTRKAVESLSEVEHTLRLGGSTKIHKLCRHYVQSENGMWYPPQKIEEIVLEDTI